MLAQDGGADPHSISAALGFQNRCRSRPASSCVGIVYSNSFRFARVAFSPYCVKTLDNTGVFSAAFALSGLKTAPWKLHSTCEQAVFEGLLRPSSATGLPPGKGDGKKAPKRGAHWRQEFKYTMPVEIPARFERAIAYAATRRLSTWLWDHLEPGAGIEPASAGSKPALLTAAPAR